MPRWEEQVTDDEIVAAVFKIRLRRGACTLPELAAEVGLSTSGIDSRVNRLIGEGRLVRSKVPGSLRTADEQRIRR